MDMGYGHGHGHASRHYGVPKVEKISNERSEVHVATALIFHLSFLLFTYEHCYEVTDADWRALQKKMVVQGKMAIEIWS